MNDHPHGGNVAVSSCPECVKEGAALMERGRYGYNRADLWDMWGYLSGLIGRMCRDLAENIHGCPARLAEPDVDAGCEKWKAILAEIAEGFEAAERADKEGEDPPVEAVNRSLDLLKEWWFDLWD
jgi:hypothetical protein